MRMFGKMHVIDEWTPATIVMECIYKTCIACSIGGSVGYFLKRFSLHLSFYLIIAFIIYSVCESVGASGIMGLFCYGISIDIEASSSVDALSDIIEAYVYLCLGYALSSFQHQTLDFPIAMCVVCMSARIVHVFVICILFGCSMSECVFMSFCGIRGAISFALVLSVTSEYSAAMQTTVFVVILSSTIVFGSITRWLQGFLLESETAI